MQGTEGRPVPGGYPTIEQIFKLPLPTLKHVPQGARAMFAECLARASKHVCVHNDIKSWTEFFMLPKCSLGSRRDRGGAKAKKRAEKDIKSRCKSWLDGNLPGAWAEATRAAAGGRGPKAEKTSPLESDRAPAVHKFLQEGQIRKAASWLLS